MAHPRPASEPAIRTRGLTRCYHGKPVVRALNLQVPHGCVYALLGRNGAGKSTLVKMLTGMVHPDAGSAEVLGEDCTRLSPATRARIAYIAENHPLYGWMTVRQLERFTRAFYREWNDDLFGKIINHFGLSWRRPVRNFSNGQRAQVSLALALAPEPELLILDDPTLGLDTVVRRDFLESFIQLIHGAGRTILLSSHILGDVERVADRIGILQEGSLVVDCPTDHFKQSIRRLVLTFAGPPPAYPLREGVVRDLVEGQQRELVIANFNQSHLEAAEALDPLSLDVVELNLEDAFIEYTRGSPTRLPALAPKQTSLPQEIPT